MPTVRCSICQQEKPADNFFQIFASNKLGVCKSCASLRPLSDQPISKSSPPSQPALNLIEPGEFRLQAKLIL